MSADNWAICPRCHKRKNEKIDKAKLDAGEKYGKIPQKEYLALLQKAESSTDLKPTLREDYECGTDKYGALIITYDCSCKNCGFKFKFEHEEDLDI